jgi:hypothetical protein
MAKQSDGPDPSPNGAEAPPETQDVALIVDKTEDNEGFHVLRRRGEDAPVEFGTVRPLKEGKPIDGEVVSLRPRKGAPLVCDVKTELAAPRRPTSDGPPQVATDSYRRGWDAIWGSAAAGAPSGPPAAKPN